jgi:hypothetical protein
MRLDAAPDHEELLCPVPHSAERFEETTRRELIARGHREFLLHAKVPRWVAVWQITSRRGEQEIRPADPEASPGDRRLGLPALPLIDRSLAQPEEIDDLPPRPPLDAATAQEAARNFFEEPEAETAHLRLVWFRVVDFRVESRGRTAWGSYVVGADRVLLPDSGIPSAPHPVLPSLLARYGVFVLFCGSVSLSPLAPLPKLVALSLLLVLAYAVERGTSRAGNPA